jgi:hypothetical protein
MLPKFNYLRARVYLPYKGRIKASTTTTPKYHKIHITTNCLKVKYLELGQLFSK